MSTQDSITHRSSSGSFGESWNDGTAESGGSSQEQVRSHTSGVPARRSARMWWTLIVLLLIAISTAATLMLGRKPDAHKSATNNGFSTNNSYINGLYTNWDIKQSKEVFEYVFRNLDDEVTIYPSENYYYFNLTLRGKALSGAFNLDVLTRDSGILGFGFVERLEDRRSAVGRYTPTWQRMLGPEDDVYVTRVDDSRYKVSYEGKTVIFNLHNIDTARPVKARLTADEEYVGPSFDESGLKFFLIYNKAIRKLYWVLNEDGYVAEEFTPLSYHVMLGDRTEFAFYPDSINNRKILVGVQGLNIGHNNWFDGPFDQLPDNLVKAGKIDLRKYLESHLGYEPGTLDIYGNFIKKKGAARAAVSPYTAYFERSDLSFVDSSVAAGLTGAQLYGEITRMRYDILGAVEKGFLTRK